MTERPAPQRPFVYAGLAMMIAKRYWIEGYDLDDLYQIACEAIWRAEPRYDGSKSARSTYLTRVAVNEIGKVRQGQRAKMRTPPTGGVSSMEDDTGYGTVGDMLEAPNSDPALIVEQRDTIRRALEEPSLSKGERACLVAAAVGAESSEAGYSRKPEARALQKIRAVA